MYPSEEHFEADEDYDAMGTYDAGREDVENTIDQMKMSHPTMTVDKDSVMYLTYQSGSSNKFHVFFLAQDKSGNWFAFNGYARIGYAPRIQRIYGPASIEQCRRAMNKKITTKERKGYSDYFKGKKWYATAETYGAEMQYMDLPVIPDSYGNDSATEMSGRGVPVWYGSAENWDGPRVRRPNASDYIFDHDNKLEEKLNELHDEKARLDEHIRHSRSSQERMERGAKEINGNQYRRYEDIIDEAQEKKYELQRQIEKIMSERSDLTEVHLGAEGMEMTPDIEGYPGLPVVPDSYGTNSALESGQGVPQWYGSAEDANPSGGSTGNQVVSWESGGLSSPSGPPSDIYWAEGRGKWSEADAAHALLRRKSKKQRTIDRKRSRRQKYSAETKEHTYKSLSKLDRKELQKLLRSMNKASYGKIHKGDIDYGTESLLINMILGWQNLRNPYAAITYDNRSKSGPVLKYGPKGAANLTEKLYDHRKAEGERIRNAGELVEYIDGVWDGQVSTGGPFTLPPYLDDLVAQDLQETMRSHDELDLLFRDGSMASCIYDARNNTLNTFVVAYEGDSYFNSETLNSYDWDKTEYEKKDLEIVKPFGTAMKATMGVAAGTAAILGIMVALTKIGE